MRFLADMGVSLKTVEWLRNQGHDANHLRDEGLQKLPDDQIFEKAAKEKRILLTFDLDFTDIAIFTKNLEVQTILFRLRNAKPQNVIHHLNQILLSEVSWLSKKSCIITVEESRFRIRELPI